MGAGDAAGGGGVSERNGTGEGDFARFGFWGWPVAGRTRRVCWGVAVAEGGADAESGVVAVGWVRGSERRRRCWRAGRRRGGWGGGEGAGDGAQGGAGAGGGEGWDLGAAGETAWLRFFVGGGGRGRGPAFCAGPQRASLLRAGRVGRRGSAVSRARAARGDRGRDSADEFLDRPLTKLSFDGGACFQVHCGSLATSALRPKEQSGAVSPVWKSISPLSGWTPACWRDRILSNP
jgi:hypothetical protein